jgi:uncharacterized protein YjeT (DUF2065 family)
MQRTRLSLFYLAGYLLIGGIGFLVFPQLSLKLLLSNGSYPDLMVRLVGMFMMGLGLVVVQFIRLRADDQYPGTLVLRTIFLPILGWMYWTYKDPMLLVLIGIVAFGYVLTMTCFLWDRATASSTK